MGYEPPSAEPDRRDAARYGDAIADIYDIRGPVATPGEIAFLAELAAGGRVLELGIGTGRVAVPLAERGLEVHGIEASERLVERLKAKPGAARITVHVGDFREIEPQGEFSLVFAVQDTFSMLTSQEDQLACFRTVAAHLAATGAFVIEAASPARLFAAPPVRMLPTDGDAVWLVTSRHDPAAQWFEQAQIRLAPDETQVYPMSGRYAWPAELDLMAELTGLQHKERWGGWDRGPFTSESGRFVAVYTVPDG